MLHTEKEGTFVNKYKRPKNKKSVILSNNKITNKLIASWFGYSNDSAFNSSSAKERILKGVEEVIKHIKC